MIYYHGTDQAIAELDRDICLTDDYDLAEHYAADKLGATIVTIDVAIGALTGKLADDADLVDMAAELGKRIHSTYEAADDADVQAALTARGYVGAEYGDTDTDGRTHTTLRLWADVTTYATII